MSKGEDERTEKVLMKAIRGQATKFRIGLAGVSGIVFARISKPVPELAYSCKSKVLKK